MTKNIRAATPASVFGQPTVDFRKDDFEAIIQQKGYDIVIEKALRCPCETSGEGIRSDCQNCFGVGYFFINPLSTRAIITGINVDTAYKDWSIERIGNVSLTVRDDEKENLSFMDKITVLGKYGIFSQNLRVRATDDEQEYFVFTTYKIGVVKAVYVFNSPTEPLVKLSPDDYSINEDNACVLNIASTAVPANSQISVYYQHEIQYHVVDIPHELRASYIKNSDGKDQRIFLPMNAIARRAHFVFGEAINYNGTGVQDNSDY